MMGIETLRQRPTDLRAREAPTIAMSALPGDDAQRAPAVMPGAVARTACLSSVVSPDYGMHLPDAVARDFVREHFAVPQSRTVARNDVAPGKLVSTAMILMSCGQFSDALSLLESASERTTDYWVHHYYALALWRANRRDEAKDKLLRLVNGDPKDFRPRHALGRILLSEGRWTDAANVLRGATELPNATAAVYADFGVALLQLRTIRTAIGAFRMSLAKDPRLSLALNNLGVCYLINGDHVRAKVQFMQAIALEPGCRAAIDNLVELDITSEDWAAAESVIDGYLQRNPNDEQALERLAWIKLATKNHGQAKRLLERLVRVDAASASTWNNLALVHAEMGEYMLADVAFQRAIQLAPSEMRIRENFSRVLSAHGRHAAVLAALPAAQALTSVDAAVLRANSLAQRGVPTIEMLDFIVAAQARFPDSADLEMILGYVLTSYFGQVERAIVLLRDAHVRRPSHAGLANNLAYAMIKKGDITAAREVLAPLIGMQEKSLPMAEFLFASWGLLRIREGVFDDGIGYYRLAHERAHGRTKLRLQQKILVEEARHLLSIGERHLGRRKLKEALASGADAEFTDEARELQGASQLN